LYTHYMANVLWKLADQVETSQKKLWEYYDRKRQPAPWHKINDWIMLDGRNIYTK
jgi:hypothetical protein